MIVDSYRDTLMVIFIYVKSVFRIVISSMLSATQRPRSPIKVMVTFVQSL